MEGIEESARPAQSGWNSDLPGSGAPADRKMGIRAIYRQPRMTIPEPGHNIYPYLLRDRVIDRPDQVWCADVTYIPMARGFLYLVAVMDWYSRKVPALRLSNTMTADFCVETLQEALARFKALGIFTTDSTRRFISKLMIRSPKREQASDDTSSPQQQRNPSGAWQSDPR